MNDSPYYLIAFQHRRRTSTGWSEWAYHNEVIHQPPMHWLLTGRDVNRETGAEVVLLNAIPISETDFKLGQQEL